MVHEAWGTLWNRERVEESWSDWSEAIANLECLPEVDSIPAVRVQQHVWHRIVKKVSNKSARGADAFTAKELTVIPTSLQEWLFDLFQVIEREGQWPTRLTEAKVVMLAKGNKPALGPLECRPITILSRIYRCWAKIRSEEVIRHLVQAVDVETAGASAGLSADMVIAHTLNLIENANCEGQELFGLVVDLVKCFNRIPRLPLLAAFLVMGIPVSYLRALEAMLSSVQRFAEISHHMGEGMFSTCGFPEGCAFSVATMLMLSIWAAEFLKFNHPEIQPNFFADNWGLICDSADVLKGATRRLQVFADFLLMEISPEKSWVWATSTKGRKSIRDIKLYDVSLTVEHRVTDMGCDVSYGCAKVKK